MFCLNGHFRKWGFLCIAMSSVFQDGALHFICGKIKPGLWRLKLIKCTNKMQKVLIKWVRP